MKTEIINKEGIDFLTNEIGDNTVDLILTDPPYIISKESGMDTHYKNVKQNEKDNVKQVKTEEEWLEFKKTLDKPKKELDADKGKGWSKENYIKYGTILGTKYCTRTDYGEWDKNFTIEQLNDFLKLYFSKLKKGGTLIIWFDLWKISELKQMLDNIGYKQIRIIEWIKDNPLPLNQYTNYLTNCREIALTAIKGSKPTFNSKYDKGIYYFPMESGKHKFHPTQKSLKLFETLIEKHSNENDLVIDTFLGSGTTAVACKNLKRDFKGCEVNKEYFDKIGPRLL